MKHRIGLRGHVVAGAFVVLGAWLSPVAAFAQSPTVAAVTEAVYLKDGSVIRGRITELKEGSHVLVQLETGQVARVRWDFVARVERSGGAAPLPPPATTGPAVATMPAPAAATTGATVIVHIESPEPVKLEAMRGRQATLVCESPCDIAVPIDSFYRIGGSIRASKQFKIAANPGERVVLHVDPTSKGGFVGGVILVSLGGVSLLIGSLVYLVSAAIDSLDNGRDADGGKTAGLVMMGLGAGGIGGGIALIVANGSSKVEQQRAGAPAASAELKVRRPEAAPARDPWTASIPAPVTFPFTVRF